VTDEAIFEAPIVKRVAVFGNAGAGKSTLARKLAIATGLPLHALDLLQYRRGGGRVADDEFIAAHAAILAADEWIIDGFGTLDTLKQRFAAADTLVYIDLPVLTHAWWVTKRLVQGQFKTPEGWPDDSPIWESSLASYRVILRCHRQLTPWYRTRIKEMAAMKQVHHLTSRAQIQAFLQSTAGGTRRPG